MSREKFDENIILSKPEILWTQEEITQLAEYALAADADTQAKLLTYGSILMSDSVKRVINAFISKSGLKYSPDRQDIIQECIGYLYNYAKYEYSNAAKKHKPISKIPQALRPHGTIGRKFYGLPAKIAHEKAYGDTILLSDDELKFILDITHRATMLFRDHEEEF